MDSIMSCDGEVAEKERKRKRRGRSRSCCMYKVVRGDERSGRLADLLLSSPRPP